MHKVNPNDFSVIWFSNIFTFYIETEAVDMLDKYLGKKKHVLRSDAQNIIKYCIITGILECLMRDERKNKVIFMDGDFLSPECEIAKMFDYNKLLVMVLKFIAQIDSDLPVLTVHVDKCSTVSDLKGGEAQEFWATVEHCHRRFKAKTVNYQKIKKIIDKLGASALKDKYNKFGEIVIKD